MSKLFPLKPERKNNRILARSLTEKWQFIVLGCVAISSGNRKYLRVPESQYIDTKVQIAIFLKYNAQIRFSMMMWLMQYRSFRLKRMEIFRCGGSLILEGFWTKNFVVKTPQIKQRGVPPT